jgi:hypothetical protein
MLKTVSSVANALGALNYKGTWNAATNTPTLASGVGTQGDYYVVSVAGATDLDGITNWGVGDWAAFNGSVWQRVEGGADGNFVNLTVTGEMTVDTDTLVVDDTNNRVGVGTAAPLVKNETKISTSGLPASTGTAQPNACFRASSSATTGIIDIGIFGGNSWIQATDRGDLSQGYNLSLNPNGGDVKVGNGNLVISTSGKGIDFSATAGTGTSELFDDYEEGVWTPTLVGNTTAGTYDLTIYYNNYTKVGNLVTVDCFFGVTVTSAGSGATKLDGIPFLRKANSGFDGVVWTTGVGLSAGTVTMFLDAGNRTLSETRMYPSAMIDNAASTNLPVTNISTGDTFRFTMSYFAA